MNYDDTSLKVFSGGANRGLSRRICEQASIPLSKAEVGTFSDGETKVQIGENVRGQDVFIIQPTCSPANQSLIELLVMADALKRASAESITAVIPYLGYSRSDRRLSQRAPISAKLVADLIEASGVDRVVTLEVHAGQIGGFYDIPFDTLHAYPVFLEHINKSFSAITGKALDSPEKFENVVVVSPDAGGVERARQFSKHIGAPLAIVDKRRPKPNVSEVMNLIGDVKGRDAVLIDDMIDTAGTICSAAVALMERGAKSVRAYSVHSVLSGPAIQRINDSPLTEVVVTDTVPITSLYSDRPLEDYPDYAYPLRNGKFTVLSTARIFAEAIRRIHQRESISSLFA